MLFLYVFFNWYWYQEIGINVYNYGEGQQGTSEIYAKISRDTQTKQPIWE